MADKSSIGQGDGGELQGRTFQARTQSNMEVLSLVESRGLRADKLAGNLFYAMGGGLGFSLRRQGIVEDFKQSE